MSAATILTYISSLAYVHKIAGFHDPTGSFLVQKTLKAIQRKSQTCDIRMPITLDILGRLVDAASHIAHSDYEYHMLKAFFLVMFFGFFRIRELMVDPQKPQSVIDITQVTRNSSGFVISIAHFKHNVTGHPTLICLTAKQDRKLCPVEALIDYVRKRGRYAGSLFLDQQRQPVTRNLFCTRLKSCVRFCGLDPNLYKSHSFRVGACTLASEQNIPNETIRLLGRWKSDAFKRYIRTPQIMVAK